jgi:hypothetical protein
MKKVLNKYFIVYCLPLYTVLVYIYRGNRKEYKNTSRLTVLEKEVITHNVIQDMERFSRFEKAFWMLSHSLVYVTLYTVAQTYSCF